jgi:hypothetical protein
MVNLKTVVHAHSQSGVDMAEVTYFVALSFVAADGGLAPGEPVECLNPNAALMRAEALSRREGHVGAVAFSHTGDPATGDWEHPRGSALTASPPGL